LNRVLLTGVLRPQEVSPVLTFEEHKMGILYQLKAEAGIDHLNPMYEHMLKDRFNDINTKGIRVKRVMKFVKDYN